MKTTLRYFLPLGVLAAGSVMAFATLPQQMAGMVSFVAVALGVLLDRSTRSLDTRPRGAAAIAHLIVAGLAFAVALVLAASIARDQMLWLSIVTSIAVLLLFLSGTLVAEKGEAEDLPEPHPRND